MMLGVVLLGVMRCDGVMQVCWGMLVLLMLSVLDVECVDV